MNLTATDRQIINEHLRIAASSMEAIYRDLGPPQKGNSNVSLARSALSGCQDKIGQIKDRDQAISLLRTLATNLEGLISNTYTVALQLRELAVRLESQ